MAETKTKIAQELTPEQLADFCAALTHVPHGEMAARIMAMAKERGISIGKSAAYEFRNKEAMPYIERLRLRRQKAEQLNEHAAGDTDSARTLADFAASELSQMAFDFVTELDGSLDLTTKEGLEAYDILTKSIKRLRDGDRAMVKQLQDEVKALQEKAKETAKQIISNAEEAGASPELVETIRSTLNFRPPQEEPKSHAA